MAYQSDKSGRPEIYVRPFPNASAGQWQVTTQGGAEAIWRRDGKELFDVSPDRKLMSIAVGDGPSFATPTLLFSTDISDAVFNYAATGDGQRFLSNIRGSADATHSTDDAYIAVLNWSSMLKR